MQIPTVEIKTPTQRIQGGEATTDLVFSAHVGNNAPVFAELMRLHVPIGSRVADVTFGKGAFWAQIPDDEYVLVPSDIKTGVDFRCLPYPDGSFDCVVLDPPYMEGLIRKSEDHLAGSGSHGAFRENYSQGQATDQNGGKPKYHDAVLDLYFRGGAEAFRVLRPYGCFVVKCQDEVSANRQRLTHVELINKYEEMGFYCKDLFVVVRTNRPGVSRLKTQEHARKNHSYFLVFTRLDPRYPKRIRKPKSRTS